MKPRSILFLAIFLLGLLPLAAAGQSDPRAAWAALTQASFDPQKVATVSNVVIERDLARITLRSGTLGFAQPVNGRVLQAAFRGSGTLSLAPKLPLEIQQLRFHTGSAQLEADFSEAVFIFSDATFEEIAKQVQFTGGDASSLQKLFADRNQKLVYYGLNYEPRLLHVLYAADPEAYGIFHAEMKTDKHGYLWLDVDNHSLEEISLVQFDESRYALNVWCSFPAGGRTPQEVWQAPGAKLDVFATNYNLDITVDKDTTLSGTARVTLLARAPVRVLELGLDPNLRVEQVTDATGAALTFFQPRDPKGRFTQFGNYLTVVLPEEAPAMQPLELTFRYAGKNVVSSEGVGVFFASSFGWYPTLGTAAENFLFRFPFEITLRVPKNYEAVAVGNRVDEDHKEGDYTVSRWVTDVPVAVAGFAFGSYYVREQELESGVKVQTYVNRNPDKFIRDLQIRDQLSGSFDNPGTSRGAQGGAGAGVGPDPQAAVRESLNPAAFGGTMVTEISNSLKVFEAYFGPYPYKKLAVSNIPLNYGYGQGWPGLLYVSSLTFIDSTQRQVLFGGGASARQQVNITDRFRAHETSHQWWGHVVGWKSYHDQWLSEGFAEFSGLLYASFRSGRKEFLDGLRGGREELLSKDREGAVYDEIGTIYAGVRLSSGKHPGGYSTIVYTKGGWVLHMLRMMLYDTQSQDPDHRFKAMMQDFTKTYYNQPASTVDFQRIAEKHMTAEMSVDGRRSLDWFFNQWVYGTGIPHYTLSYQLEPQGQGVRLHGAIQQSRVPPGFVMPVPMYAYIGDRVVRLGFLRVTGEETPFDVTLPASIDKVTLNEMEDVLCTWEMK